VLPTSLGSGQIARLSLRVVLLPWAVVSRMPQVFFTPHLRKHVACESREVSGRTVGEALAAVFESQPEIQSYVLDDQGRVRQHIMIFVDDRLLADRDRLTDVLAPASQVYVMQALSGG
jgi:molybdopterin synthase sulfur carrier subunit